MAEPTEQERIMNHFNQHAKCKKRVNASPRLAYEPGCHFIECEHADCRCRMNEGGDMTLSEFIAKWEARHG